MVQNNPEEFHCRSCHQFHQRATHSQKTCVALKRSVLQQKEDLLHARKIFIESNNLRVKQASASNISEPEKIQATEGKTPISPAGGQPEEKSVVISTLFKRQRTLRRRRVAPVAWICTSSSDPKKDQNLVSKKRVAYNSIDISEGILEQPERPLRATGRWKRTFLSTRANPSHSIVTIDIPPNTVARQLHFGFSVEILRNNEPIFVSEWPQNIAIANGFILNINLEAIQTRRPRSNTSLATVYPRQPGLLPVNQEIYSSQYI